MVSDAVSFVNVIAFFDNEIRRRLAGAGFQSVEKLAEIVSIDLDAVNFLLIPADIPGQVDQNRQVFSRFNFANKSGSLAAWQKLRL